MNSRTAQANAAPTPAIASQCDRARRPRRPTTPIRMAPASGRAGISFASRLTSIDRPDVYVVRASALYALACASRSERLLRFLAAHFLPGLGVQRSAAAV